MDTLHKVSIPQDVPNFGRDASHDAHAQYNIVGVCQLDTNLGQWGPDWTHAVWNDIHDSVIHTTREPVLQFHFHLFWAHPLGQHTLHTLLHVGHCGVLVWRTDECPPLYTSDICWICSAQVAVKRQTSHGQLFLGTKAKVHEK